MDNRYAKALVLNVHFLPLGTVDWDRAITLDVKNKDDSTKGCEVIDFYKHTDAYVRSQYIKHRIPAVLKTVEFKKFKTEIKFSRKNVFIRDRMCCQYCGLEFIANKLTYDHVVPRTRWDKRKGSPTKWENIVTCCFPCNQQKADRLPHEADMKLLKLPTQPNPFHYILGISPWSYIPDEWKIYLTPVYKDILNHDI